MGLRKEYALPEKEICSCCGAPMLVADHTGKRFFDTSAMCAHWGITSRKLNSVLDSGFSLEDALTKKCKSINSGAVIAADKPDSLSKICRDSDVSYTSVRILLSRGLVLEDAIAQATVIRESSTDPTGKRFKSIKQMCKFWGVSYDWYSRRLKLSGSKEYALSKEDSLDYGRVTDGIGNWFSDIHQMSKFHGIQYNTLLNRIKRGLPISEVLYPGKLSEIRHKPVPIVSQSSSHAVFDHIGFEYPSQKAMCEFYSVSTSAFRRRIKRGLSLEQALLGVEKIDKKEV